MNPFSSKFSITIIIFVFAILVHGCIKMSEYIIDDEVGVNGGFEIVRDHLPVNWLMYTPNTVPEGDFDIVFDQTDFVEGKQSLKFVVRECSSAGAWHSPGFTREFPAKPGEHLRISFWLKNLNSDYRVDMGGVASHKGQMETFLKSNENSPDWQKYEYEYTVPAEMTALRIELNILQPGTFWIDGFTFEKIEKD